MDQMDIQIILFINAKIKKNNDFLLLNINKSIIFNYNTVNR
jgi:hypothetical protein